VRFREETQALLRRDHTLDEIHERVNVYWMSGRFRKNPIRIKPSSIEPGPVRHAELPADLVTRIIRFKNILHEVEPGSLEDALKDFSRDVHPEREVAVWENIANAYARYISIKPGLPHATKQEAFHLLLGFSMGAEGGHNRVLPKADIKELERLYFGGEPAEAA
jgi:hypothetical protein